MIWHYLNDQMSRWEEVLFGVGLGLVFLYLEDWIDGYRNRKNGQH